VTPTQPDTSSGIRLRRHQFTRDYMARRTAEG
jgi:hypothetical protein